MLYLILFGSMAAGFYAAVSANIQVSHNETRARKALLAAESGMAYVQYLLSNCTIPHGKTNEEMWALVVQQVKAQADTYEVDDATAGVLVIRDVSVADGATFTARLTQDGGLIAARFSGTVGAAVGGTATRTIQMSYAKAQHASEIFDYGIASKSSVRLNGNARITGAGDATLGSVLSTTAAIPALTLSSNSQISGDVSFASPHPGALNISGNATISGYKATDAAFAEHVHYNVSEPEFPTIDTTAYQFFAGKPAYGGTVVSVPGVKYDTGVLKNILIKANTNPTFDGNMELQGVIYIEAPNHVTISSNVIVTGAIVVQNDPPGDTTTNTIEFRSNVKLRPISALPATAHFPPALRALTGAAILAPNFYVNFNSNFGSVGGSIIAGKMHFDSNASGTVKGSIINLDDTAVTLDSNATITVESQGTSDYPNGVYFSSYFTPLPDTYTEIAP